MQRPIDILFLEDDPGDFHLVQSILAAEDTGYHLVRVTTLAAFEEALTKQPWELILADYFLPGGSGLDAVAAARRLCPLTPCVVLSANRSDKHSRLALDRGATAFVPKKRWSSLGQVVRQALPGGSWFNTPIALSGANSCPANTRLRGVVRHAPGIVLLIDRDFHILEWGLQAEKLTGWPSEEMGERDLREWLCWKNGIRAEDCRAAALASGEWQGEIGLRTNRHQIKYLSWRWILLRNAAGQPDALLLIATESPNRDMLEEQFLRTQRLECIGALAGGVAHDLNNVLAPILISLNMLKEHCRDEESRDLLATLEASAARGAGIVRQMLGFARGSATNRGPSHWKPLIREMVRIASETFPKNIQIRTEIAPDLGQVMGDTTQLHQVLMNLCVNARDAMPEGGLLTISASNRFVDECFARTSPWAKAGAHVVLAVTDTGSGIASDVLARIFDPFFTTKGPEKGTGLGLSTVLGIVKNHQGFVEVKSRPGMGSCFEVFLPRLDTDPHLLLPDKLASLPRGEGELILVIDDEENIRQVVRSALERYGYRTLLAQNGAEAVELYASHQNDIDGVITDIAMPIMDGETAIRSIRRINPHARFIISSGRGPRLDTVSAIKLGVNGVLPKPFTAEDLLVALHHLFHDDPINHWAAATSPVMEGEGRLSE